MERVPVMKFCPPVHLAPKLKAENAQDLKSRARDRFSLVGKCAIGKSFPLQCQRKISAITLILPKVFGGTRGLALTLG